MLPWRREVLCHRQNSRDGTAPWQGAGANHGLGASV